MCPLIPSGAYSVEKGLCYKTVGNSSQDEGSICKLKGSCIERNQALIAGFITENCVTSHRMRFELFQFLTNPAYIFFKVKSFKSMRKAKSTLLHV